MTLTEILLLVIAFFVFMHWYEHSKELPKIRVKYRNLRINIISFFIKWFKWLMNGGRHG